MFYFSATVLETTRCLESWSLWFTMQSGKEFGSQFCAQYNTVRYTRFTILCTVQCSHPPSESSSHSAFIHKSESGRGDIIGWHVSDHPPLPSDVSEPLYPVPNFVDDPLTNPGSWQFVRKSDVSFDLVDLGPWWR